MGRSISLGTVFYEIQARTQGLDRDLQSAEKSLARTSKFILANPVAAAGALGVALLGVAAKATAMAEEVDVAFRKVGALVPDLANNLKRAQRGVAELAVVTGKSQAQLLQEAETIAKGGVDGTTDLLNRLRVLQDLADAAGADVSALAGGLDATLDVFALSADKAGEVAAKLFAIGQGRVPIEDLFAAIQGGAPAIRALGLDFDVTAAALGTLLDQGLNAKQAGKELKALAAEGATGAEKLRALAGAGIDTADAFAKLAEADRLVRESASRSAASIRQGFNNELLELGTRILPLVTAEMKGLVALIDRLQGRGAAITTGAKITTARVLGQELAAGHISPTDELDADKVKRFADAIRDVRGAILLGRTDLAALSKEELEQLSQAFAQFQKLKGVTTIDTGIQERIKALAALRAAGGTGTGGRPSSDVASGVVETAAELRLRLQGELSKFTDSLVDDSEQQTARFLAEMHEKLALLTEAERASLQQLVDQVADAMRMRTLLLRASEAIHTTPTVVGAGGEKTPLRTDYSKANAEIAKQAKAIEDANDAAAKAQEEATLQALKMAHAIEQGARGAIQLAQGLGLISEQAAKAASDIAQIGEGVAQIAIGGVDFSSILSIAGGLTSLIGGLFGESPADKHRREVQEANTQAILELSHSIGVFGGRLSGTAAGTTLGVGQAAKATLASHGPLGAPNLFGLGDELAKLGLSMGDLRSVAASLGVTFATATPSVKELGQLVDAIAANDLAARTGTFAGQLQQLQDVFEVFDITDPLEQLRKLVDLFDDPKFGSPALRKALAGLDLSTPEGRAAAEAAIQELVKRLGLSADQGGITLAEIGDKLSPEEFRQALLDLERRLDELGQISGPQGETQGFAVSRTITEAQGSLVISQLGSVVYWQQALYDLLDHRMLQPPNIIPGVPSGSFTTIDLTVVVNVPPGQGTPSATELGTVAADAVVNRLNQALGANLRNRKLLAGDVTRV